MPNCPIIDPLVTPFVDGELPDADRRVGRRSSARLPPCHSRVVAERACTRSSARAPSVEARRRRRRCARRCRELARACASGRRRATPRVTPRALGSSPRARMGAAARPLALAASLTLVVGGAFVYQATRQSARVLAAELTADHMKCLAMNRALGTHQAGRGRELDGVRLRLAHAPAGHPARAGLRAGRLAPVPLRRRQDRAHHVPPRRATGVALHAAEDVARAAAGPVLGHEAAIWCVGNRTFVLSPASRGARSSAWRRYVKASLQ
jgi:hypothetical protein